MTHASTLRPTAQTRDFPEVSQVNGSETSKTTYLDRSVSLIDLKTAANHDWKQTLWTTASYVTLIAFYALAVSTFVTVGLFAPIYLPIAAFTAFCSISPALQIFLKFQKIAEHEGRLAQQSRDFVEEHKKLPTTSAELLTKLRTMGIERHQIKGVASTDDLTKFTPLIAQYEYWRKEIDNQNNLAKRMTEAAQKVILDEPDNVAQINECRLGAIECQERALKAKIHAAFIHAVIRNPQFTGEMSDLCTIKQISFEERALGDLFRDPKADEFLIFNKSEISPVTMSEMNYITDNSLAQYMSLAMA